MKDFIIVANGNFLVKEIILEAMKGKTIIALDGAANKLARIGILPDVVLGDFDSVTETTESLWGIKQTFSAIEPTSKPYAGKLGVTIVPALNQDFTDLVKAIHYCDEHGAKSITIVCATGGRLDHHEATMIALRTEYKKDRPILLHTEQQTLRYTKDETIVLEGQAGDKCGVIATHTGTITSDGLEYECKGHSESTSNSLRNARATITMTGSGLAIMPPQLTSQRQFMQKSEVERLKLQLRDAESTTTELVQSVQAIKQSFFNHLKITNPDDKTNSDCENIAAIIKSMS